jgi:hypothetical protein
MKCYYCQNELLEDFFGNLCPNEKCHSIDGTIILKIFSFGSKFWYTNGKLHRENGPAIEFANGKKEYWLNGKRIK